MAEDCSTSRTFVITSDQRSILFQNKLFANFECQQHWNSGRTYSFHIPKFLYLMPLLGTAMRGFQAKKENRCLCKQCKDKNGGLTLHLHKWIDSHNSPYCFAHPGSFLQHLVQQCLRRAFIYCYTYIHNYTDTHTSCARYLSCAQ